MPFFGCRSAADEALHLPPSPKSLANCDIGGAFHPSSQELQVDVLNVGIGRDAVAKSAPASLSLVPMVCFCTQTATMDDHRCHGFRRF